MFPTSKGTPFPLGATHRTGGVNFSIVAKSKASPVLHLFSNTFKPLSKYTLNQTGDVWHIEIQEVPDALIYAYKIEEDWISDPYAKAIASSPVWKEENAIYAPFCFISKHKAIDWGNDTPPNIAKENLIIYEMHVRGFTIDPSSQVQKKGTFLGIIEKIPYLLELGVNALELLPMQEFNEQEYTKSNPITQEKLCNFWGYSTVNFFSPMTRYAFQKEPGSASLEFQEMVKALHQNGIEVILDIVFNHTAEGNENGPIFSYKVLEKTAYYFLDKKGDFLNRSGCGNTFRCSAPLVQDLIIDALRYWVFEMHVDGFRFDLASILTLDQEGHPSINAPLLERIAGDPLLSNVKLIMEPWDAAGAYQLGQFSFTSSSFSEWNDQYRDTVRSFLKGTPGAKEVFATRICGSQDIFYKTSPLSSINFITSHDGFTLLDLVSYNFKHNLANGENNQDGSNHNVSWNCGIEGVTEDPEINILRDRQRRNFHLSLMLSQGIPMLFMGDEYGHTRQGNNNAWCQDNALNWFQWDLLAKDADFFRFYKGLIQFRKTHPFLNLGRFLKDEEILWQGTAFGEIEWKSPEPFLGFQIQNLFIAFNPQALETLVEIPPSPAEKRWRFVVNTANPSPKDFFEPPYTQILEEGVVPMQPFSAILLIQI